MARLWLLSLSLAANALAITIPAVPTWPSSGRCTDKSLTIPSWVISNYTVSGGHTTFHVNNRASEAGVTGDIDCTSSGCQGNAANDGLRASLTAGENGTVVTLSELWVCGDTSDKVVFRANGSTTITECAGTDCTSPIPYIVDGTLNLPVPLTPAQPTPPPGYLASTCAYVGDNQWTVSGVSYKNYTKGQCKQWYQQDVICIDPATANFIHKGVYLNLTVTNNAIEHEVSCGFVPDYNNALPPTPLRCTGGNFNEITLDVSLTGSAPNFGLKVEELWYCLENPKTNVNPTVIVATGNTSLSLNCSTATGITGTADDIITTCTDSTSHSVSGVQTAKQTLPAFSLVTAYPAQGGCTYDSVVNPTFYLRNLFFETNTFPADDPNSATLSRFTAGLTGPGFSGYYFYQEDTAISGTGINSVYSCENLDNGQKLHWKCNWSFDPFKKVLTLDKVWQCTDKNAATPLYFDGSGTFDWTVDPYSDCTTTNTSVRCNWYDDLNNLAPGIPYDIPKVTVSLQNAALAKVMTLRVDGQWEQNNGTSS